MSLDAPKWPRPARAPLDLAWERGDPAPIHWPDAVVASRIRDLDHELVLARDEKRSGAELCWALRERAAWTPAAAADAFFDALVEPPSASACAVAAALAMEAVTPRKRAHAALELLGEPGPRAFFSPRAAAVADAVAAHPAWSEEDRALHEWMARQATIERADRGDGPNTFESLREAEAWTTLEPIFERVIAEAESSSLELRARARTTARDWIAQVRVARGVRFTSVPSAAIPKARLFGVVALAPRVGLADEARTLLSDVGEDADVARWLLDHPPR